MKDILKTSHRLARKDIAFILIPILGWILAHRVRPYVIHLSCAQSFHICVPSEVSAFDRIGIRPYVGHIDEFSFYAEYAAAVFVILIPLLRWVARIRSGVISKLEALQIYRRDLIICIQAVLWNGFANEFIRLSVQRPRPFVFLDARAGDLAAHYNSFYSGHTSFSAVAMTSMVLILKDQGMSRGGYYAACALAFVITALTGVFRVLAGRHFPTDVILGALFGFSFAWMLRRVVQKIVHRS